MPIGKSPRSLITKPDRPGVAAVHVQRDPAAGGGTRLHHHVLDQRATDTGTMMFRYDVKLVELHAGGRLQPIPADESDGRLVAHRECKSRVGACQVIGECLEVIASREHVIDLRDGNDARVMPMPDLVRESRDDRQVRRAGGGDGDGKYGQFGRRRGA